MEFLKPCIELTVTVPTFTVEESVRASNLTEKGVREPRDTRKIVVLLPCIDGNRVFGSLLSVPLKVYADRNIESSLIFA